MKYIKHFLITVALTTAAGYLLANNLYAPLSNTQFETTSTSSAVAEIAEAEPNENIPTIGMSKEAVLAMSGIPDHQGSSVTDDITIDIFFYYRSGFAVSFLNGKVDSVTKVLQ